MSFSEPEHHTESHPPKFNINLMQIRGENHYSQQEVSFQKKYSPVGSSQNLRTQATTNTLYVSAYDPEQGCESLDLPPDQFKDGCLKPRNFIHPFADRETPADLWQAWYNDISVNCWLYGYEAITGLLEKIMALMTYMVICPIFISKLVWNFALKKLSKNCKRCFKKKQKSTKVPRSL